MVGKIKKSTSSPTATGTKPIPMTSSKNGKSANLTTKRLATPVKRGK